MSRFSIPDGLKPSTFTEGQRTLFGCLFSCAGMAFFAAAIALTSLLVWGGWGEDHYGPIIETLGWALILTISISGIAMAFLAVGGPVGRAKAKGGKDGFEFDMSGDGEPQTITAQATVTSEPTRVTTRPPESMPPGAGPVDQEGRPLL